MADRSIRSCNKCAKETPHSFRNDGKRGHRWRCMECHRRACRGTYQNRPGYTSWVNMNKRCYDTAHQSYPRYGALGITVCEAWQSTTHGSFDNFMDYVGPKPSADHSIDRWPNNKGNYAPGNVRWATRKEQQRNKTNSVYLTIFGESKNIQAWVEDSRCVVCKKTFESRLARNWEPLRSLTTKPRGKKA